MKSTRALIGPFRTLSNRVRPAIVRQRWHSETIFTSRENSAIRSGSGPIPELVITVVYEETEIPSSRDERQLC